jgi:hypothetical protein
MKSALLFFALWISGGLFAQTTIPPGTILPVTLESSISSRKIQPGDKISARVMQDVPLPGRTKLPAGAKVTGRVVLVDPAGGGSGARVSFGFDTIVSRRQQIPVTTNLRALASNLEVQSAQLSIYGSDRGTPSTAQTTVQVGGEVVYRGGGPVKNGSQTVGTPVLDGVLVRVAADPVRGCRGEFGEDHRLQALWVFSSDACGVYGYSHVIIAHAGRSDPAGLITLAAKSGNFIIRDGSGMLLRVDAVGK